MELENPSNVESKAEVTKRNNGEAPDPPQTQRYVEDIDSSCSTPYASAPSSPGRGPMSGGYFFSAPASPMHFVLSSPPYKAASASSATTEISLSGSFDFAGAVAVGSMISADELFHNGQIRPMKLSSHLQRPQTLAPLLDVDIEYEDEEEEKGEAAVVRGRELRMRSRSLHRRARSMSPLRNSRFQWRDDDDEGKVGRKDLEIDLDLDLDLKQVEAEEAVAAPSESSASSSRSSSSGRNSKKWIFLKDLLYRSKSEGSGKCKEKFWHSISFSPSSKEKSKPTPTPPPSSSLSPPISAPPKQQKQKKPASSSPAAPGSASSNRAGSSSKPTNGVGKRRVPAPSPHERHYAAKRAQAEEMRKRTFLPYRQGLLGCLGFSSRSYGAMNGFARALNPVSSR